MITVLMFSLLLVICPFSFLILRSVFPPLAFKLVPAGCLPALCFFSSKNQLLSWLTSNSLVRRSKLSPFLCIEHIHQSYFKSLPVSPVTEFGSVHSAVWGVGLELVPSY